MHTSAFAARGTIRYVELDSDGTEEEASPRTPTPLPVVTGWVSTPENTLVCGDATVYALRPQDRFAVWGHAVVRVVRGAACINGDLFHSGAPPIEIMAPAAGALPVVLAAQVTDRALCRDRPTEDTAHMFQQPFKLVVEIAYGGSGVCGVTVLHPQLKNLWPREYAVESDGGLQEPLPWRAFVLEMAAAAAETPCRVLVVGAKNTGKLTLLRVLVNRLVHSGVCGTALAPPLQLLDLDPGQPLVLAPTCVLLTTLDRCRHPPFYGSVGVFDAAPPLQELIGATLPAEHPGRYRKAVERLVAAHTLEGAIQGASLVVNTPGWIKGYGWELLKAVAAAVQPTHLVTLGQLDALDLVHEQLVALPHTYAQGRYLAPQLRLFGWWRYFHQNGSKYISAPVVESAPYAVLYASGSRAGLVSAVVIPQGECGDDVAIHKHVREVLEASVVGMVAMDVPENLHTGPYPLPRLLPSNHYAGGEFLGLALVHSFHRTQAEMRLYTPVDVRGMAERLNGRALVLVHTAAAPPVRELAYTSPVPYVRTAGSRLDRVWRVRRNVLRGKRT